MRRTGTAAVRATYGVELKDSIRVEDLMQIFGMSDTMDGLVEASRVHCYGLLFSGR